MSELMLDRAGRWRSPATLPGFHAGYAPGNKGLRYPADARTDRDHVASRAAHPGSARARRGRSRSTPRLAAGPARQGRAPARGRHGRMGWEQLQPWLEIRREFAVGPLLCVINGTTRGRHWSSAAARAELRRTAAAAGGRGRVA